MGYALLCIIQSIIQILHIYIIYAIIHQTLVAKIRGHMRFVYTGYYHEHCKWLEVQNSLLFILLTKIPSWTSTFPKDLLAWWSEYEVTNYLDRGLFIGGGGGGGGLCTLKVRCPFFKNLHKPFRKKNCICIPCIFGISDQFSYQVQEFMLKNDTLKNGTSHIGSYGKCPPPGLFSLVYIQFRSIYAYTVSSSK